METQVFTDESYLSVFYRFVLPDGTNVACQVTPAPSEMGDVILSAGAVDAAVITPWMPPGLSWSFLPRFSPTPSYIQRKMGITGIAAEFYAAVMPLLVAIEPADRIAEAADAWFANQL